MHKPSGKSPSNIYLLLLQIYLNPRRTTKSFEKRITNLLTPQKSTISRVSSKSLLKTRSRGSKKIAAIEVAEETKASLSSNDSGRSDADADEFTEEGDTSIMHDEVLDLLSRRWDRINGAQALKLLPRETKLQVLLRILSSKNPFHVFTFFKESKAWNCHNISLKPDLMQTTVDLAC